MANQNDIKITKSSGNVFADLEIPDAEEYLLKAELARQISNIIKKKKLKQKDAADLLKVDQPKISALSCGKLSGFSLERLLRFLVILNQDINIIIKPHVARIAKNSFPKHIYVEYITT
jgi:predicted XRE-type DNA-binding protein